MRNKHRASQLGVIDMDTNFGNHLSMKSYTAVVEKCSETGLYVGYVPGIAGAHSQGESLDELKANLEEVLSLLCDGGGPLQESEFVGTQTISVA